MRTKDWKAQGKQRELLGSLVDSPDSGEWLWEHSERLFVSSSECFCEWIFVGRPGDFYSYSSFLQVHHHQCDAATQTGLSGSKAEGFTSLNINLSIRKNGRQLVIIPVPKIMLDLCK